MSASDSNAMRQGSLPTTPLGRSLERHGAAAGARLALAERKVRRTQSRLADHLRHALYLPALTVAKAEAEVYGCGVVDPVSQPADPDLAHRLGVSHCLREGLLPWRRTGAGTVVLTCRPDQFSRHQEALAAHFGDIRMAVTTEDQINTAIRKIANDHLVARAESLTPDADSCRSWSVNRARAFGAGGLAALSVWGLLAPGSLGACLMVWAVVAMVLSMAQRFAGAIALSRSRPATDAPAPTPVRLPVVTVLVPLFKEREIAGQLIANLSKLDYPHELLDICIMLEEGDATTREALVRTNLPRWMRAIVVPGGSVQTKPRALNYGLSFARGSLVGVYDAEDAPEPDQIRKVVAQFAASGPDVACLQGVLDFYNTGSNWLSRCFTVEYTTWFRLVLPGLARMGFVLPLGGTTLFFRRDVLEKLGGWDAHNVTEDADLGVRLARRGYRTDLLDSVTYEEANCRPWSWVKQRSRWLKGYAITYMVHMRDPVALWRDLGPKRFVGVQMLFLGTLSQFALAPLLWSLWAVPFGLPHPLGGIMSTGGLIALGLLFLAAEAMTIGLSVYAVVRAGKGALGKWVPTLHLYYPLAVLATYKGLFELFVKPFYWDKTEHGVFAQPAPPTKRQSQS